MRNKKLTLMAFVSFVFMLNASVNAQSQKNNTGNRTKSEKSIDMLWTEMGPSNIGGRTRALLIDKNNSNVIYAGAIAGGLWKSTSLGTSWTKIPGSDMFDNLAISCLYQSPNGDLYYGTGEYYGYRNYLGTRGKGIWKSTDNGATWTHLTSTDTDDFAYVTQITGTSSKIYAATYKGIRVSSDGGNTWTNPIDSSDANFDKPATDIETINDGSIVVASLNDQAYVCNTSDDVFLLKSGTTGIPTDVIRLKFSIAPSNANYIYCLAVNTEGKLKNIYKSTDKGSTWNKMIINVTSQFQPFGLSKNKQGRYNCSIAVSPVDPEILFIGGIDLYRYTPANSFEQLTLYQMPSYSTKYIHESIHVIKFSPNFATDKTMFVGTDGGVFRSTDEGDNWSWMKHNYSTVAFTSVGIFSDNKVLGGTIGNNLLYNNLDGTYPTDFASYIFEDYYSNTVANVERSLFNPDFMIATKPYGRIYNCYDGSVFYRADTNIVSSSLQNLGNSKEPLFTPMRVIENFYDTNSTQHIIFKADTTYRIGDTIVVINPFKRYLYHIVNASDLQGDTIIQKKDTVYIKDTYQSLTAVGLNKHVWISWEALNPAFNPPIWYPVINNSNVKKIQSLEFTSDGNIIYFSDYDSTAAVSSVYRLSNLQSARDSVTAYYTSNQNVVSLQKIGSFNGTVNSIAVDPQNNNNILVTLSDYNLPCHIYYSTNAATTVDDTMSHNFVEKQGNLTDMPVYSAIVIWNNSQQVVLGTEKGIWATEDITSSTPSWVEQNNGIPRVPVSQIRQQIHKNGWMIIPGYVNGGFQTDVSNQGIFYAATMGRGIFRCETFKAPVNVPENNLTHHENYINVYPNPAQDMTNVSIELNNSSPVQISIMNMNGQVVSVKKWNSLSKGHQVLQVPVSNLSTGFYIISVKTNKGVSLSKLIKN